VRHPRNLLISTTAILAYACTGVALDTAAAQADGAVHATAPVARIATSSGVKAKHSRRRHACGTTHRRRRAHATCRSHAARSRSTGRTHDRSQGHAATPKAPAALTPTPTPTLTGPSIASVLATPCENTELTPEPGNLQTIEAATLCLINQERARNGELPLQPNSQLERAAQGHSEEMVSQDYFAHVSPSGLTPVGRVQATGYISNPQVGYTLGENLAWGTLQLSTPTAIVAAWIASPEHLANILYAPYRDTAIGVVAAVPASLGEGQPGAVYSQEFGVIVE
jgi:uncharacterized protein YkwD